MKRTNIKLLSFLAAGLLIISSCKKDKFTEEDALEAQQLIDIIVRVFDGATVEQTGVEGAKVKTTTNDGSVSEATTNADGIAVFNDVNIGTNSPVIVSKDGYTTVAVTTGAAPNNFREKQLTVNVAIFNTTDSTKVATVKGKITIDTDLTNRNKETVEAGVTISATRYRLDPNTGSWDYDYSFIGTTDANGEYNIKVPVQGEGSDRVYVTFPTIITKQTAGEFTDNTQMTWKVNQRDRLFGANTDALDNVPSLHIAIAAPTAAGSGLAISAVQTKTNTSNGNLDLYVIAGGSGYMNNNGDTTVYKTVYLLQGSSKVDSVQAMIRVVNGEIRDISVSSYLTGAYRHAATPTIDLTSLNSKLKAGSGASIGVMFEPQFNLVVTSGGSAYMNYDVPDVKVNYTYYSGNVKYYDVMDLSGTFDSRTDIVSGKFVVNNWGISNSTGKESDTLYTTNVASIESIEIKNQPSRQAYVPYNTVQSAIQSDSTLSDISLSGNQRGAGYDPSNPPAVTLNVLGSWGTGAKAVAVVNASGEVTTINFINEGNKFIDYVNDHDGDGSIGDAQGLSITGSSYNSSGNNTYYFNNAKPGSTYILDAYYGTGEEYNDELYTK